MSGALAVAERVAVWDAALAGLRRFLRGRGYCEATTRTRVAVPVPEPYIEPLPAPPGHLVTSPEQGLKRLLAADSGPVFEIAHVFRAGERGRLHAEEFHLAEWYRPGGRLDDLRIETVAAIRAVAEAVRALRPDATPPGLLAALCAPAEAVDVLAALASAVGVPLRGDEPADRLWAKVRGKAADLEAGISAAVRPFGDLAALEGEAAHAAALAAWTALFTWWADRALAPGGALAGPADRPKVVHLTAFPAALAALARVEARGGRRLARRFETVVAGVELANGYDEERDAAALAERFAAVAALRRASGERALPAHGTLARDLAAVPPAVGVALGVDRAVMLACGAPAVSEIAIHLGPDPA